MKDVTISKENAIVLVLLFITLGIANVVQLLDHNNDLNKIETLDKVINQQEETIQLLKTTHHYELKAYKETQWDLLVQIDSLNKKK